MQKGDEDWYIGAWILGQYRIEQLLAKGEMSAVYLARQVSISATAWAST